MDSKEIIDGLSTVFRLVASSSSSATLSVVGLALLLVAGALAYKAAKSKPDDFPSSMKAALFLSLIGGMIFSASGPSLALVKAASIPRMTSDQAFKNLQDNSEVKNVVRLIAYDPEVEPGLAIDRLTKLGPKDQLYSFVASYDELVGYKVSDALAKVGASNRDIKRVSAIIFPLKTPLFPANARGLLQVIKEVESRAEIQTLLTKKFLDGTNSLNSDQAKDLAITSIPSYKWDDQFGKTYPHYCALSNQFACNPSTYSAHAYVGSISHDWHPLGFSQNPREDRCNLPTTKYCEYTSREAAERDYRNKFGARAFLIRNLEINKIPGRRLIDFDRPYDQVIPEIGKN
ncbi:hypothetical protein LPJ38_03180 [Bradyrhizobium daqingense]|uniref:Uncharacterized protein n=1 Tax=Bradyrhizobium daqingense TaxID=993502 RepID=A0A562LJS8_9BRAD|nr:hypothetical protein [Bradyrhizobium daqingense]TWI07878.1 hypothetical protein IQ17_02235 [Bradyrhizobium daqingense]UFS89807.1 hypothetical protein LPJ38_03180 [Bradyrhizobium daqingense]